MTIASFGFKRRDPPLGYVIFDVRRINDPEQDQDLRALTGKDVAVRDRILKHPLAAVFLRSAEMCVRAGLPIAFGCNQGRHRSVALAEELGLRTRSTPEHLDIDAPFIVAEVVPTPTGYAATARDLRTGRTWKNAAKITGDRSDAKERAAQALLAAWVEEIRARHP